MTKLNLHDFKWKPINTAPRNGQFVELKGDSGYMGTPYRIIIARYEQSREGELFGQGFDEDAWRSITGGHLTDDGPFPTHWRVLTTEFDSPPDSLAPNREARGQDGSIRKAHYGPGEQPWDTALRLGWGPQAAAFCILRYLRRDKAREHSLESARWYWARLKERACGASPLIWYSVLGELRNVLTGEEMAVLDETTT